MIENKVTEFLRSRRSVKEFTDESVSEEQISAILDSGRWAPSWLNIQPWKFIVIDDPEVKSELCAAAPTLENAGVRTAPVCIAVCVEDYPNSAHLTEDGAAATLNMSLAAHSLGLGTYWVGLFDRENRKNSSEAKLREILHVPDKFRLISLLPVGVPANTPTSKRKELDEIVCQNFFSIKEGTGVSAEQTLRQKIDDEGVISFTHAASRLGWVEGILAQLGDNR